VPPPVNPLRKLTDEWLEDFVDTSFSDELSAPVPVATPVAAAEPEPASAGSETPSPVVAAACCEPAAAPPPAFALAGSSPIEASPEIDWSSITLSSRRGYRAVGVALAVASALLAIVLWSGRPDDPVEIPAVASTLPPPSMERGTAAVMPIEIARSARADRGRARGLATRPSAWVCAACRHCRSLCVDPARKRHARKVRSGR
jgi:hypothetical protein